MNRRERAGQAGRITRHMDVVLPKRVDIEYVYNGQTVRDCDTSGDIRAWLDRRGTPWRIVPMRRAT